jgi:hypothetical protein
MALAYYKWLKVSSLLPFFAIFSVSSGAPTTGKPTKLWPHPFHVSVVEIDHNATDKTLEISCKLFTDDFEKVLEQNYKTKVDLINPPLKKAMDTLVKKYINTHLFLRVDGLPVHLSYIGFEHESEAVYAYLQVDKIEGLKKIEMVNSLMHDLFTDQVNLVHVIVGGSRKSTKLDYPQTVATLEWN